ncbi:hypothetical protein [Ensifer soli]|uniref:hypothetical protein n=1 Tax=Ciceribacter sp. sgz301302 TaxID=3342379 RepID=UPI0035BA83C7
MKTFAATLILAAVALGAPAASAEVKPFGSTCVKVTKGASKTVCVAWNGKTIASTDKFRNTIPTRGQHTGCKASDAVIACSGGTYATGEGSGRMPPFKVRLKAGKPVAANW